MKSAIITGASKGIGLETALLLSNEYDYIAICARNNELLQAIPLMDDWNKRCECDIFPGDISDYQFVSKMIETICEKAGHIDTLINNAGISSVGLFTDMSPDKWQELININLTGTYNTCHLVVPHMVHEKSGKILNISSVWGLAGASCEVGYSATKGAINSFTKALAKELAPSNITVNAIAFGAVDTDMNKNLSEEEISFLCDEIPIGRMATPKEAARCIRDILCMPSYLTGEIIKIDGAWI